MKKLSILILLLTISVLMKAQSPIGTWKTIDDKTGEAKSLVQITEYQGKYYGKVIKFLRANADPNRKCVDCKGAKKNQLVMGMNIIEGLYKDGNEWTGGTITDPENGKEYRCKIYFRNGNANELEVRGYIGFSLIGRSQIWYRQ